MEKIRKKRHLNTIFLGGMNFWDVSAGMRWRECVGGFHAETQDIASLHENTPPYKIEAINLVILFNQKIQHLLISNITF